MRLIYWVVDRAEDAMEIAAYVAPLILLGLLALIVLSLVWR